jgi:hypothetical protein
MRGLRDKDEKGCEGGFFASPRKERKAIMYRP